MSLTDKKNALFGSAPMSSVPAEKKTAPKAAKPTIKIGISPALKAKKIGEAKESEERGDKFLKTTLFQWSPDHLAASAAFDNAANCYRAAEELDESVRLYLRAADSHQAANTNSAAAMALMKAGDICKQQNNKTQAAAIYHRSAMLWGLNGEITKTGEFLIKAAKELETEDPARALEYFYEGLGHIIPEDTPVDRMSSTPAIGPDLCRDVFKFLLSIRASAPQNIHSTSYTVPTNEVLAFANRMIRIYEGLESEASESRMRVTITLLQLELGDVVAADRTFLDHLSSSSYLKSTECKLAEDFIAAFKQMDVDMLDEAQKSHHLVHLDRDVQKIAKSLSLMADHNAPDPVDTAVAPTRSMQKESTPSQLIAAPPSSSGKEAPEDDNGGEEEDLDALVLGDSTPSESAASSAAPAPASAAPQEDDDDDEIDLC